MVRGAGKARAAVGIPKGADRAVCTTARTVHSHRHNTRYYSSSWYSLPSLRTLSSSGLRRAWKVSQKTYFYLYRIENTNHENIHNNFHCYTVKRVYQMSKLLKSFKFSLCYLEVYLIFFLIDVFQYK